MSAYAVVPRQRAEEGVDRIDRDRGWLAIRSLPENEATIRGMFGNKISQGEDVDPYDWEIHSHVNAGWNPAKFAYGAQKGLAAQTVQRGDWIVLTPFDLIYSYTAEKFDTDFCLAARVLQPRVAVSIAVDDLPPQAQ